MIRVRELTVALGPESVLEDVELEVERGEVLGVVGATGSGKSVLLRSIIGLIKPLSGSVELFGLKVYALAPDERSRLERRCGVLFQNGALFGSLTVAQNIQVPLREHTKLPREAIEEICAVKLGLVGLPREAAVKYPAQLSGGMRKRAALARALALDPQILFLDEPTAGLDPLGAAAFDELIRSLHRSLDLTVLMVTHDLDSLWAACDRIAVLAEKRIVATGSMEELLTNGHPWVRRYFHGPRARAALGARAE